MALDPNYRARQDAQVRLQAKQQIDYCQGRREPKPAPPVDEWTWTPEPTAEGLEDLL